MNVFILSKRHRRAVTCDCCHKWRRMCTQIRIEFSAADVRDADICAPCAREMFRIASEDVKKVRS